MLDETGGGAAFTEGSLLLDGRLPQGHSLQKALRLLVVAVANTATEFIAGAV